MSFLKTLVVGTLAVLGGCTVVVGGCTVGAVKVGVETAGVMAETAGKSSFNKLYSENPAQAESKYIEVATMCYTDKMRLALGSQIPQNVIDERVNFDIYEIRINQSGNQNNIQHLTAWRKQSDKKIISSVADKKQRYAIKKYFKKVNKGNLLETMCIANGLSNRHMVQQASVRR